MSQMIKKATRITKSSQTLIDLIFTNREERIAKSYNPITGLSDHNLTLIVRTGGYQKLLIELISIQGLPLHISQKETWNCFIMK